MLVFDLDRGWRRPQARCGSCGCVKPELKVLVSRRLMVGEC
jgi:hypothetical protein